MSSGGGLVEYSIVTNNLSKKFGSFTAVDSINLRIKPGDICAFLGPNGAGKTTAIRILCGILKPSSGNGSILGYDLLRQGEKIKEKLGYMSQKFSLYHDLTVRENLDFYAGIYRLSSKRRQQRIEEMISLAGLAGREDQLVANLSQGFKQRLALSCAIISDPQVIFLDEPTSGVSPAARRSFFNIIQEQANQGKTIIISTHFMDEAERCGQIAFFNQGRLLALNHPEQLKKGILPGRLYRLEAEDPIGILDRLSQLPGVKEVSLHGRSLHILLEKKIRNANARSLVKSLFGFLKKRRINWGISSTWFKVPSIPI
jgi:ABC-2 type transport system ATP-binding protein